MYFPFLSQDKNARNCKISFAESFRFGLAQRFQFRSPTDVISEQMRDRSRICGYAGKRTPALFDSSFINRTTRIRYVSGETEDRDRVISRWRTRLRSFESLYSRPRSFLHNIHESDCFGALRARARAHRSSRCKCVCITGDLGRRHCFAMGYQRT